MNNLIKAVLGCLVLGCTPSMPAENLTVPTEIVELGAIVTEELPEQVWGGLFKYYGFEEPNTFKTIHHKFEFPDGIVNVTNSYLTIFNHGGPHVDVPYHLNLGDAISDYEVDAFIGLLKVIDVSGHQSGRTVSLSEIKKHDIQPDDIVLIYTEYVLPGQDELPERTALSREAAQYLANLPVKAFGTDSFNVEGNGKTENEERSDTGARLSTETAIERIAPIHHEFLSKGIPVYEQLFNVDKLLNKKNMLFVGQPLNIAKGDGMIVRPVVFIYD